MKCHDCKKNIKAKNGYYYKPEGTDKMFYKCEPCFKIDPVLRNYAEQKCLVFSRVVGYMSPVNQWNKGKAEEFKDRKVFKI